MDNEAMFDGKGGEGEGEGGEEAPELVPNKPSLTCNAKTKVPVTVLTGFLGAGKSTLLGRILSERHGMKIAVVMNELGPTCALDRAILWNKTGTAASEWLTVENGCLCCTAKNETFLALESLLLRRDDIEHVIVEASGAADPAALVSKLWIDEALESRVVLDAVIAVVDVSTAQRFLVSNSPQYSVEAARQVAIADLILLNKIDLAIGDEQIEQAEAVIHSINSVAQITKTHFSNAPIEQILHLGEYNHQQIVGTRKGDNEARTLERQLEEMIGRVTRISVAPHPLNGAICSFTLYPRRTIGLDVFERWLFTLLWERRIDEQSLLEPEDELLRIKGLLFLEISGVYRPYSLQVVQEKYDLEALHKVQLPIQPAIIFIGRLSSQTQSLITSALLHL